MAVVLRHRPRARRPGHRVLSHAHFTFFLIVLTGPARCWLDVVIRDRQLLERGWYGQDCVPESDVHVDRTVRSVLKMNDI